MENQRSSLHEHHMIFKQPYELLPFHEDNIWANTLVNEPDLINSPNLWASQQNNIVQQALVNSPISKCNLDHFLLKEALMSNSLYTSVNDPWQYMSAHEIQQLAKARMSSAICSDHHYMSSNLHSTSIESGSLTTRSRLTSSLNPQSLEEDTDYFAEADATRCGYDTMMANASKNKPSSCMPSSSAFKAINMQDTRAPTCNLVPKPNSSLLGPRAFNMEDTRAPSCNLVPHASNTLANVSLSIEDQIMEMDHLSKEPYKHSSLLADPADHYTSLVGRSHDDGQASLSDTASSMPSSSPMFHMASCNFVKSEACSSNLVPASCYSNSVSHPSATLHKLPSSSINYHVNIENDQIIKCPNNSSSLSLLAASTIPSSLDDTSKHYINLQQNSAVSLSHPSTTTPAKLCQFVNHDQVSNNDQVQKNTDFSSSISLHAVPETTISSMYSSSMSDGDQLNEDPVEGAAKATMDDQVAVDIGVSAKKSMNANQEITKKLVDAEVHPSHIGDADNCSAAHDTPSLDSLKTKKTSNKKGKKKNLQKHNRQQRIALVTQSENERLEDGFRWRKYGQKSVKNSPYPRSYYRCTTSMCSVKKRVERSPHDTSMVITTYEGNHNHQNLSVLRGIPQSNLATQPYIDNDSSALNTTNYPLQWSLGTGLSTTKSFEYNYYANRYSLIMQLQAQHSYAPSAHPPVPNFAKTYE